jgi:hypothetical protein
MTERKPFWLMKKFWMAVIGASVPVINYFMGLGLEVETIALIIIPLLAFIFGEAWTDVANAEQVHYYVTDEYTEE